MATKKPERRVFPIEFRQSEDEKPKLIGHAAVFNQPEELWDDYIEVIEPGAFTKSISRGDDVRALFNHDCNFVLGRTTNGTLKLSEDDIGLFTEIDPPNTTQARDILELIRRGDISQMSYAFYVTGERNEKVDSKRIRTITSIDLVDVSPVTYPAFPTTDIGLRSLSNGLEYKSGINSQQADNDRQDQADSNGTNESGETDSDKAKRAGRSASRKRKLDLAKKICRQEEKELD